MRERDPRNDPCRTYRTSTNSWACFPTQTPFTRFTRFVPFVGRQSSAVEIRDWLRSAPEPSRTGSVDYLPAEPLTRLCSHEARDTPSR